MPLIALHWTIGRPLPVGKNELVEPSLSDLPGRQISVEESEKAVIVSEHLPVAQLVDNHVVHALAGHHYQIGMENDRSR